MRELRADLSADSQKSSGARQRARNAAKTRPPNRARELLGGGRSARSRSRTARCHRHTQRFIWCRVSWRQKERSHGFLVSAFGMIGGRQAWFEVKATLVPPPRVDSHARTDLGVVEGAPLRRGASNAVSSHVGVLRWAQVSVPEIGNRRTNRSQPTDLFRTDRHSASETEPGGPAPFVFFNAGLLLRA